MLKRFLAILILVAMALQNRGIASSDPAGKDRPSMISTREGMVLAELTEQQKKDLFLKAREDFTPVSTPSPNTTPRPSPIKSSREKSEENSPTPRKSSVHRTEKPLGPHAEEESEPLPKQKKQQPPPQPAKPPQPAAPPQPERTALPTPPKVAPTPSGTRLQSKESLEKSGAKDSSSDAPIRIVKSGRQQDEGLEPAPAGGHGFFKRYRYLTPAVRRAIDQAHVKRGRWKYVIVHNSGTRQGNARIFDTYHRRVRHMQNGLAYHFVIGNGHSSGNGQIEIGNRWRRQINGGHVASDYLNNIAIGICLVGDYNRDTPTPQQLTALDELTSYLRIRVGRFKGRPAIVLGHREINPKPTDCPGRRFPLRWLHRRFPTR